MKENRLTELLKKFQSVRIAVVGDFFLDKLFMIDSTLDEPSLETGLTAYQVTEKKLLPGAAGTITNNLAALGVGKIFAVGVVGADGEGFELTRALKRCGVDTRYLVSDEGIFTPTYIKPFIKGEMRELNRLDIRNRVEMQKCLQQVTMNNVKRVLEDVDALIVLDQVVEENQGVITGAMREMISALGKTCDKIIYADSRAHLDKFNNIILKCNNLEAALITGISPEQARDLAHIKQCALDISEQNKSIAFVTCGDIGIVSAQDGCARLARAVKVHGQVDICGAGDASTAGIVTALCCGATAHEAAQIANMVSSITIRQIGETGTATKQQVLDVFYTLPREIALWDDEQ